MKKMFHHTKREYEEMDGDWEEEYYADEEYYEADGETYEDEEYYAGDEVEYEEAYEDEEAYYADEEYYEADGETYEDGEYYAADGVEYEEVYEDEEAYYADEEYYEADGETAYADEEYYAEEYYAEDDEYYAEDDEYIEDDWHGNGEKENIFVAAWRNCVQMGGMERLMLVTGVAVLVLALVTAGLFINNKTGSRRTSELAQVGSQLQGIDLIGETGLLAVADAQAAKAAAAGVVAEEQKNTVTEYEETEYNNRVTVNLSLSSIQKDLKIKFVDKETGKLVGNVPFCVTVKGPDGTSTGWQDDDMDGIIYKKGIEAGGYKVAMQALEDEKYKNYILSQSEETVEVKKDIEYKKVDVKNEIKKESEINAAKEDTKVNQNKVESALEDTVEWVESTAVANTYTEVAKSSIADPLTLAMQNAAGAVSGEGTVAAGSLTVSGNGAAVTMALDKGAVGLCSGTSSVVQASVTGGTNGSVGAQSSDTSVAIVTVNGKEITITGVSAGSAVITVSYTENGQTISASCAVTVTAHPKDDTTTKLLTADGKTLYVNEDEEYREAVYADYYPFDHFFIKGAVKYTGWQTLDGKVYYYSASGEKVTGEQVIQGAKYNFDSDGALITGNGTMGIDVSKWNGRIDWNAVKNSGVSYVIIRCGYRGSSQGSLIVDPRYEENIKGATAAGLKVGVYFFTQALDAAEAVEEASMVLEMIKGYTISYPVFLDVEASGGRGDTIDKATRTEVCKAFCETIQASGYTAGVYANKTWLSSKIDTGSLGNYKIWLAQYAAEPTYSDRYDLWQYKDTGKISGIQGNVDLNLSYLGY